MIRPGPHNSSAILRRIAMAAACVTLLASVGAANAGSARQISADCDFADPVVAALVDSDQVSVPGCQQLFRSGAPILPFRTVRLLIPPGTRVETVFAEVRESPRVLPGFWRIGHARPPVNTAHNQDASQQNDIDAGPDPVIYSSANPYPAVRAELASVQRMADYDVAFVRVYPVQYKPALGQLAFAGRLTVVLNVTQSPVQTASVPTRAEHRTRQLIEHMIDNPALLAEYDQRPVTKLQGVTPVFDYLLITRSNLVQAFSPLLTAKAASGLNVKVQTVESIASSYAGRDLPEQIRNYIRYAYTNWGVTYVLLGGDVSIVPCRYAYVGMGSLVPGQPIVPTDTYFACLDGSWNGDGDSRWGEPDDGDDGGDVDLLSEVFVGRAPVDTPAEAMIFVEKTIRYAANGHPWPDTALFLAELLSETSNGLAQGGDMFDPLLPLFADYKVTWLDDRFTTPAWTKADAITAMNQSPHLVLFNGHGNDFTLIGLENYPARAVETAHLDALANAYPFLAYSVGCNVGQFDNDRFSPDSIGEELLKRNNRGAFAAILNSRLGWYDSQDESKYSGEFQRQFFYQLLTQQPRHLGVANQLGKQDLIAHVESGGIMTYRWCYYEITLFGDPHAEWQMPVSSPADTDGDGALDRDEEIAGTDPANPSSVLGLRIKPHGPGTAVSLEWPSASGRTYSVWVSQKIAGSDFALLTNNIVATQPTNIFIDQNDGYETRFYRVSVER
ncbi:MAG: C25 family cysteine peptidase [Verrucomicrobiia bacterium]